MNLKYTRQTEDNQGKITKLDDIILIYKLH